MILSSTLTKTSLYSRTLNALPTEFEFRFPMMSTRFLVSNMGILVVTVQYFQCYCYCGKPFPTSSLGVHPFFFVHQLCKDPHLIAGLQYLSRKSSIHPSCGIQVEGNCCARWPKIIINLQNGEILSTCMCTHIHSFRYIYKYGYLYLVSWCMYSVWWCLKYTVDLLRLLLH